MLRPFSAALGLTLTAWGAAIRQVLVTPAFNDAASVEGSQVLGLAAAQ